MSDSRNIRSIRSDTIPEGSTDTPDDSSAPTSGSIAEAAKEGVDSISEPRAPLVPLAAAPTPDPSAPIAHSGVDETALFDGADQPRELPHTDNESFGLAQYHNRILVRTWSHGRVEAAEHARLARPVVLRVLDAEAARDLAVRHEFLRQAREVALLDHPNLGTGVLEAISDGPELYVAFSLSADRPLEGIGPRRAWLRSRDCLPYDNRRLALLLTDGARGLQALHQVGLVHGNLRRENLRAVPHTDRLRLHGLSSTPLVIDRREHKPPADDLADLAAAIAVLATGQEAPLRAARAKPIARALRRANPGLDPELAEILGRCVATELPDRLDRADELITRLEPLTRHRVVLATWGDRLVTLVYDCVLALIVYMLIRLLGLANSQNALLRAPALIPILWFPVILPLFEICVGWSPGRRAWRLRLVDVSGTRAARWKIGLRALLRIGWIGLAIAAGYGLMWLVERASPIGLLWLSDDVTAIALGGVILLVTSRFTRARRPFYDVITGITWGIRETVAPPFVTGQSTPGGPSSARRQAVTELAVAGERVGPNRLEREIGRGGMGAVYAAWDEILDRPVAVKLITATCDASAEILKRFEQEARLAAQVRHENVAQVFSVGQDRHRPYMVLELLHGRTLQQLVEESGPVPLQAAWSFITQGATGLRAANQLGIVHRDIKPSNLMLTHEVVVKVLDFGISKLVVEEEQGSETARAPKFDRMWSDPAWRDARLTRTGAVLGTPLYMSPEQAKGQPMDCRSDIYSLGMTLYYLLAGQPPFDCSDPLDLLAKQCEAAPPSLKDEVVGLTPERAEVLERMIAKDPEARFQNYEELLEALHATARLPERASLGPRVLAALLDLVLFSVIGTLIAWIPVPGSLGRVSGPIGFHLAWILPAVGVWRWRVTPATWVIGLRVTRPHGGRVGLVRSLVRQIAYEPVLILAPLASFLAWPTGTSLAIALNGMLWVVSL
ncbi:MAG TPA: protein kinase, partial [Isosphaeraceae bacterium]|nr:protein kinase [Isosphaeraceae bacterium]